MVSEPEDPLLCQQAAELETLLPTLMRRLFTLDRDNPVYDLPVAQLRVCTLLQSGPRPLSNLSQDLYISVSAMTQIADRLERAGMVERVSGAEDRRVRLLQLSALGLERMQSRRAFRIDRAQEALLQLSEEERHAILEAVHLLLDAATATASATQQDDPVPIRQQQ
jgi:DNA-binding MarR family transcriptional regulator